MSDFTAVKTWLDNKMDEERSVHFAKHFAAAKRNHVPLTREEMFEHKTRCRYEYRFRGSPDVGGLYAHKGVWGMGRNPDVDSGRGGEHVNGANGW